MKITFVNEKAFLDFCEWTEINKKIAKKIRDLLKDIGRSPYSGLGKPEGLKHQLSGLWSREITEKDRLVYKIDDDMIVIYACKDHYREERA
jgi:toxin YoeB